MPSGLDPCPGQRQLCCGAGYTSTVSQDDQDDRRQAERVSVNAQFEADSGTRIWVRDLSERGVFLHTTTRAPIGRELALLFTVLLDDPVSIRARGRVVRHQDDPPGMGIEFTQIDPAMLLRINDAVSRERPRDSGPPLPADDYAASIAASGDAVARGRNSGATVPDSSDSRSVDEAAQTLVNLRRVEAEILDDDDLPMDEGPSPNEER